MRLLRKKGLLRLLFKKRRPVARPRSSYPPDMEDRIDKWVKASLYREPRRTYSETARDMGVDPGIMASYFKDVRGEDLRSWRTRLRIEDAKQLLLSEKDRSISLIAWTVGFSDNSNFSRQFRKYTGLTPAQWRSVHSRTP